MPNQFWKGASQGLPAGAQIGMQLLQMAQQSKESNLKLQMDFGMKLIDAGQIEAGKTHLQKHFPKQDWSMLKQPTVEVGGKPLPKGMEPIEAQRFGVKEEPPEQIPVTPEFKTKWSEAQAIGKTLGPHAAFKYLGVDTTLNAMDQLYDIMARADAGDPIAKRIIETKAKQGSIPNDLEIYETAFGVDPSTRGTEQYKKGYLQYIKAKREAGYMESPYANILAETNIRREYISSKTYQEFALVNRQRGVIKEAYNEAISMQEIPEKQRAFNAIDQTLIIVLNKMLDPGSVVRESEYARTPEGMAYLERVRATFSRLQAGGVLSQNERKAVVDIVDKFYDNVYLPEYKEHVKTYRDLASAYKFDPTRVAPLIGNVKIEKKVKPKPNIPLIDQETGKEVKQMMYHSETNEFLGYEYKDGTRRFIKK